MKDNVLLPVTSLQTTIYAQAVTQNYHGLTIPTWSMLPTPNWTMWKYRTHPEGNYGPFIFRGFVSTKTGNIYGPLWLQNDQFSNTTPSECNSNRDCRWWWIYPRNSNDFFKIMNYNLQEIKNIDSLLVFID
jgi:hypothetical protein